MLIWGKYKPPSWLKVIGWFQIYYMCSCFSACGLKQACSHICKPEFGIHIGSAQLNPKYVQIVVLVPGLDLFVCETVSLCSWYSGAVLEERMLLTSFQLVSFSFLIDFGPIYNFLIQSTVNFPHVASCDRWALVLLGILLSPLSLPLVQKRPRLRWQQYPERSATFMRFTVVVLLSLTLPSSLTLPIPPHTIWFLMN